MVITIFNFSLLPSLYPHNFDGFDIFLILFVLVINARRHDSSLSKSGIKNDFSPGIFYLEKKPDLRTMCNKWFRFSKSFSGKQKWFIWLKNHFFTHFQKNYTKYYNFALVFLISGKFVQSFHLKKSFCTPGFSFTKQIILCTWFSVYCQYQLNVSHDSVRCRHIQLSIYLPFNQLQATKLRIILIFQLNAN